MKCIVTFSLIILLFSCKQTSKPELIVDQQQEEEQQEEISVIETQKEENTSTDFLDVLGFYVGSFQAIDHDRAYDKDGSHYNKINISIDSIQKDLIFGHSVVAGNSRSFHGRLDTETLFAQVSEPGDNKYDGIFEFTISPEKKQITGVWIANNSNLAVPKRKYTLDQKVFAYIPEQNVDPLNYEMYISLSDTQYDESSKLEAIDATIIGQLNASSQELANSDIENLNKGELEVLRNLIYARHGYSFKNRKMRYFFDSHIDWYIPMSTDIRSQLTGLEKKNIDLIKRYEQHAERYYDYFGR